MTTIHLPGFVVVGTKDPRLHRADCGHATRATVSPTRDATSSDWAAVQHCGNCLYQAP